MKENYYFAYGSNMNLDQMEFRCPDAMVVGKVCLEDYRLAFRGRGGGGVATILPEEGSHVDGILWKITKACETSLDHYEGYPHLYGKEMVSVENETGLKMEAMVYTMNAPYKDQPAIPSDLYLAGIIEGCHQNKMSNKSVIDALIHTRKEVVKKPRDHVKRECVR